MPPIHQYPNARHCRSLLGTDRACAHLRLAETFTRHQEAAPHLLPKPRTREAVGRQAKHAGVLNTERRSHLRENQEVVLGSGTPSMALTAERSHVTYTVLSSSKCTFPPFPPLRHVVGPQDPRFTDGEAEDCRDEGEAEALWGMTKLGCGPSLSVVTSLGPPSHLHPRDSV